MARFAPDQTPGSDGRILHPNASVKLYPICNRTDKICPSFSLVLDPAVPPMHFWDPMMNRFARTGLTALESATVSRAVSMMFTTIIITMTTRTRGASG